MVVRPKLHWLRLLFVLRGSVLPNIAPQLVFITVLAVLVTWLHGEIGGWKVSMNFVPFSLLGLTLAIFLSFRNSTAYSRYWEARTLWGALLNESRSLMRQGLTLSSEPAQADALAMRLCACVHALRHQLRKSDASEDMAHFLCDAEQKRVLKARFPASLALLLASDSVGDQVRAGRIAPTAVPAFEQSLSNMSTAMGGCERISNTPIPFTYTVIINRCIHLYCLLLPFGLIDSIGPMTPLIVCFVTYTFLALEAQSSELEEPFGTDPNDLPLSALCHTIEASILELVNEQPRTIEPKAVNYVLQ